MANPANALLGTSAPIINVSGLTTRQLLLLAKDQEREDAKAKAKADKDTKRAQVRTNAIALLRKTSLVVLGQEMDGITAIQYHIAFSSLNYKAKTQMSQDVLNVTWPFLRAFQEQMGGQDDFIINTPGLVALLLDGAQLSNGNDVDFEPGE